MIPPPTDRARGIRGWTIAPGITLWCQAFAFDPALVGRAPVWSLWFDELDSDATLEISRTRASELLDHLAAQQQHPFLAHHHRQLDLLRRFHEKLLGDIEEYIEEELSDSLAKDQCPRCIRSFGPDHVTYWCQVCAQCGTGR